MDTRDDKHHDTGETFEGIELPLSLDPGRDHAELPLIDLPEPAEVAALMAEREAASLMMESMEEQMRRLNERIARLGQTQPPKVKVIPAPPACLDTREGLAEFRAALPAVRVAFASGGWDRVWAVARCWMAYSLCRMVPRLRVLEAWQQLKA